MSVRATLASSIGWGRPIDPEGAGASSLHALSDRQLAHPPEPLPQLSLPQLVQPLLTHRQLAHPPEPLPQLSLPQLVQPLVVMYDLARSPQNHSPTGQHPLAGLLLLPLATPRLLPPRHSPLKLRQPDAAPPESRAHC